MITIRRAEEHDIQTLISFRALLLDHGTADYAADDEQMRNAWRAAYRRWLAPRLDDPNTVTFLVESAVEEGPMGMVTGVIDERPPGPDCLSGRSGWVQSLVVAPSWRRKGMSSALMRELMAWFTDRGVSKVLLQSTPDAERLYQAIGFERVAEPTYKRSVST